MGYRGEMAVIPLGLGGLDASQNQFDIPITNLIEAEGITFEDTVIRKEPGAAKFDATGITASPKIFAAIDWRPSLSVQRLITAASDGKLYKEVGGDLDSVTLKSGLSTTAKGQLVPAGNETSAGVAKLFYFNGVNIVQVLSADGATTGDITSPPADWSGSNQPSKGIVHGPRFWALGNANDPYRIYASGIADHEDFLCSTAVNLSVFPGAGERLVTGVSFKGLLFLFKFPHGIYWVDDKSTNVVNWGVSRVTDALGVADSPYAALSVDEDVLFLTAEGNFHFLSATTLGGVSTKDSLSDRLRITKWIRDNIDISKLNQTTSVWFAHKKLAIFAVPTLGSSVNDARLMFDFADLPRGGVPKFSYSFRDTSESLAVRRGTDGVNRPIFGDDIGLIWLLDQTSRSKAAAGYLGQFRTPENDFSFMNPVFGVTKKIYDYVQLIQNAQASGTLSLDVFVDGTLKATLSFDLTKTQETLPLGAGPGFRISLRGKNSIDAVDFSEAQLRVFFRRTQLVGL